VVASDPAPLAARPFDPPDLARPPYDQLAGLGALFTQGRWPTLAELDALVAGLVHPDSGRPIRFVADDQHLKRDGLGFSARIATTGAVATRPGSWHDLYSALMWARYPRLKLALNRLEVADLAVQGRGNRTRRQQAIAHVDEAGLLVASDDPALLEAIDAHDWQRLFWERRADFGHRIVVHVFGHALLELGHAPHVTLAGKTLRFLVPQGFCTRPFAERAAALDAAAAGAVLAGRLAADPSSMPSLPLAGIPGWFGHEPDAGFIASAECFRPRPPGRCYDAPVAAQACASRIQASAGGS
jgi:hypothetical protein